METLACMKADKVLQQSHAEWVITYKTLCNNIILTFKRQNIHLVLSTFATLIQIIITVVLIDSM